MIELIGLIIDRLIQRKLVVRDEYDDAQSQCMDG